MRVLILGSGAGGGLPQWNCGCPQCAASRAQTLPSRTQSSIAVSLDGEQWLLLNASPDVRTQLNAVSSLGPRRGALRDSAVRAAVITSADIDHVAGLLVLREGGAPVIYASTAVQIALREGLSILPTLAAYGPTYVRDLVAGQPVVPTDRDNVSLGITVEPIALQGAAPLYMRHVGRTDFGDNMHVTALILRSPEGRSVVYAPGVRVWEPALASAVEQADLVLIDGTCWTDDEMQRTGIHNARTSRDMGHLPLSGDDGLLSHLARATRPRKVLVHINNTNPVLAEPRRAEITSALVSAGVEIAHDGQLYSVSQRAAS